MNFKANNPYSLFKKTLRVRSHVREYQLHKLYISYLGYTFHFQRPYILAIPHEIKVQLLIGIVYTKSLEFSLFSFIYDAKGIIYVPTLAFLMHLFVIGMHFKNYILSRHDLRCACVRCIFRLAMCDCILAPFLAIM